MNVTLRTGLVMLVIVAAACAAFADVTSGFNAITADGVRRVDLARAPRPLPDTLMLDSAGRLFRLSDVGAATGKVTLVALIYTHCETICRSSAGGQSYLQNEIRARGLADRVHLLTISFDPGRDTPDVLDDYVRRQRADPALWTVATVERRSDLGALLAAFGVVVLPDEWGGYSHNAALFRVDRSGRLAYAYDVNDPEAALADLLQARRD